MDLKSALAPSRPRVKWAVLAGVVAAIALVIGAVLFIQTQQHESIRRSVLKVATKQVGEKKSALAIRHLEGYLAGQPDDLAALELLAKVRAEAAATPDDLVVAARVNDQLCRIDPEGKDRQETRRRVADLYIRYSDLLSSSPFARVAPTLAVQQYRYRAAETVAREMVSRDMDNADGHRLLARALEGISGTDPKAPEINEAAQQYEKALLLNPKDVEAAERLARIDEDRRHDPEAASAVLDRLMRALPNSPEVRLARYFRQIRAGRQDLAGPELAAALEMTPKAKPGGPPLTDAEENLRRLVILTSAEDALRRNDPKSALAQLDSLPKERQSDPRVRLIRGWADFLNDRPEEAINEWRSRLMNSGGTDVEMTWLLAKNLIQTGQVSEAGPLVDQYRRLIGEDSRTELDLLRALLDEKSGSSSRALMALDRLKDKIDLAFLPEVEMAIGRCHLALRDEAGAEMAFRRAVKANPRASAPRRELARLLQRREPQEEIAELRRGLAASPNDPDLRLSLADALLRQQARIAANRRTWPEVDAAIVAIAELLPGNVRVLRLQARRRELAGDIPGAEVLLSTAAAQEPSVTWVWTEWARMLDRADRRNEAIAVLDRAPVDKPDIRIIRAALLVAAGQRREACSSLERGIERLKPEEQQIMWKALGDLHTDLGEKEEAKEAYDRWVRSTRKDDPRPRLFMIGRALQEKDFTTARAYLELIEKEAGSEDSSVKLARAELLLKSSADASESDNRPAEALRLLDDVLTMTPNLPEAHLLRAEALTRRGRIDDAIAACRRARDLRLGAATPFLVSLMTGRRRFEDLDRLPRLVNSPDNIDRLAAQACLDVNEPSWASRFVDRVAEGGDDSSETLGWRAKMYERMGRLEDADGILLKLADRRPTELEPWLDLVHVQALRGKYAAINATIERAKTQVRSDSPEMVEARCLWARGDRKAAERAFITVVNKRSKDAHDLAAAPVAAGAESTDRDQRRKTVVRDLMIAAGHLWTMGRLDKAEQGYQGVLALEPGNRDALRGLAIVVSNGSAAPEAWDRAWAALNSNVKGPEAETVSDRVARAIVLGRAPDFSRRSQAIELLKGLQLDVSDTTTEAAMVREALVRLLIQTGQNDLACQVAAVPESRATNAQGIAFWAETLIQAGRKEEAAKRLDWLAKFNPGDPQEAGLRVRLLWDPTKPAESAKRLEAAYLERGYTPGAASLGRAAFNMLASVGSNDIAMKIGLKLSEREPGLSWMPAKILARLGKHEDALDYCRVAIDSGTTADIVEANRITQAIAFADPNRLPAVAALTRASRKRDPDQSELWVAEAGLLHLKGEYAAEVKSYRELLASHPDDVLVLNNLAWVLSEGVKNPAEALAIIDRAIEIRGRVPSMLDTRGVILTRLKRYPEAIFDLEAAVAADAKPTRYYHLARAYQLSGDPAKFQVSRDAAIRGGLQIDQIDPCERIECASLMNP